MGLYLCRFRSQGDPLTAIRGFFAYSPTWPHRSDRARPADHTPIPAHRINVDPHQQITIVEPADHYATLRRIAILLDMPDATADQNGSSRGVCNHSTPVQTLRTSC